MKVGDEVIMLFHGFGLTSEEDCEVVWVSEDGSQVGLDNDHTFDTSTGKCLDDTTDFGCSRSLKI